MPRYKKDINAIYISERLQERMRMIGCSTISTIVAPMGYGKTTALMWYLNERKKRGDAVHQINIYSDDVKKFWNGFCNVFRNTSIETVMTNMGFPESSTAIGVIVEIIANYALSLEKDCFIFLDDYHLLENKRVSQIIYSLADMPVDTFHLVIASRAQLNMMGKELHLGRRLNQITVDDLRLNMTELTIYSKHCGMDMDEERILQLSELTEGWFSAVYLNMNSFVNNGRFLQDDGNIYRMMEEALVDPMDGDTKMLLEIMSLMDEFSLKQAVFMTKIDDAESIILELTNRNAFVHYMPDKKTYRLHPMLKECMQQRFLCMSSENRALYERRFAGWLEKEKQYYDAAVHYEKAGEWEMLWTAIETDWGRSIDAKHLENVINWYHKSTDAVLGRHPKALAILMTQFFYAQNIAEMRKCMEQLRVTLQQDRSLSATEKEEIEGEMFLRMSFLEFNNIKEMSKYHKQIKRLRPQKKVTWTQGVPSVLAMYHRCAGALELENQEMKECIPIYSKRAYGHGIGAAEWMAGETALMRGDFIEADILCRKAMERVNPQNDFGMYLGVRFLALRVSVYLEDQKPFSEFKSLRRSLVLAGEYSLLTTLDLMESWMYSLYGVLPERLEWIVKQERDSNRIYPLTFPIFRLIAGQLLLLQRDYRQVIARYDTFLEQCNRSHFLLCRIYLHIQTARAQLGLGRTKKSYEELEKALELAAEDRIMLPFAETDTELNEVLMELKSKYPEQVKQIFELKIKYEEKKEIYSIGKGTVHTQTLSKRERQIVTLISQRKTNDEIANKLMLSEGTIKQYIHKIYEKLSLTGTAKGKRQQLIDLNIENN